MFLGTELFKVKTIKFKTDLLPLLKGHFVGSVFINNPEVNFMRYTGYNNITSLLKKPSNNKNDGGNKNQNDKKNTNKNKNIPNTKYQYNVEIIMIITMSKTTQKLLHSKTTTITSLTNNKK